MLPPLVAANVKLHGTSPVASGLWKAFFIVMASTLVFEVDPSLDLSTFRLRFGEI